MKEIILNRLFFLLIASGFCCQYSFAQQKDTIAVEKTTVIKNLPPDTVVKKKHSPRKATIRSAILPGWGQAYNHSYWKIPVVYAALGITGYVFNYNRLQYVKAKYAYFYMITRSTADADKYSLDKITDAGLRAAVVGGRLDGVQQYRNGVRKYVDYSALYFIFFWTLNIVDATVDGHLKDFDVSNELSMQIKPSFNALPNTIGMSVVFTIGKHPLKRTAWQMP